jgi:hypothetical protein
MCVGHGLVIEGVSPLRGLSEATVRKNKKNKDMHCVLDGEELRALRR